MYDESTQELGWSLSTLLISSQITVIVVHEVGAIPLSSSCDMWSCFSSRGRRAEEWSLEKHHFSYERCTRISFFVFYHQLVVSDDPHDREMGYLLLFSLHEVISSYISLSDLINVLNNGLNDPDFSVASCLSLICSPRRFSRWPSKRAATSLRPRSTTTWFPISPLCYLVFSKSSTPPSLPESKNSSFALWVSSTTPPFPRLLSSAITSNPLSLLAALFFFPSCKSNQ